MIKIDMEMPVSCNKCFAEFCTTCRILTEIKKKRFDNCGGYTVRRHPDCPLIEVKE